MITFTALTSTALIPSARAKDAVLQGKKGRLQRVCQPNNDRAEMAGQKKGVNTSAFGRCRAVRQIHRDAELMASWFIDPWPACMVDRAQFTLKPTVQRYTKKVFFNTIWSCTNNYKTTLKHLQLHSISWHASKIKNIHIVFWTSAAKIQQETVLFYFSFHSEFSQEKLSTHDNDPVSVKWEHDVNLRWIWRCMQSDVGLYLCMRPPAQD